jgi:hypothetical protein
MRREVEWALLQSRSSSLTTIMILPILSSEDFPCADGIFLLTVHAHVALRFAHAMPSPALRARYAESERMQSVGRGCRTRQPKLVRIMSASLVRGELGAETRGDILTDRNSGRRESRVEKGIFLFCQRP